jgi:hypothetical protein
MAKIMTSMNRPRLVSAAGLFVLLVLFGINVMRAWALDMGYYPPLRVVDAIPAALSDLAFQNDGYTSLKAVSDAFFTSLQNNTTFRFGEIRSRDGEMIDRAIGEVLALNPDGVPRETEVLGADDKGVIDLVKLSFKIFGYKAASPLYLYFSLLFFSGLIFVSAFNTTFCQTILAGFLVAHDLLIPVVFYHLQLQSVVHPRFLPVLSMIAALHCALFMVRGTVSAFGVLALALQVGLMIFVIHMRSVAMWQVAIIAIITVFVFAHITYKCYFASDALRSRRLTLQRFVRAAIPILFIAIGLVGLTEYRKVAYDQRYLRGDETVTHVFWHSIWHGLAFNPDLAKRYQLKVDDFSVVSAVGRFMSDNARTAEWESIGGNSAGYSRLRWAPYDRNAGEALVDVCSREPGQCLATVFFYKPLSLLAHLSWLYGFQRDIPDVGIFVPAGLDNVTVMELHLGYLKESLDSRGRRFLLWDPLGIFMAISFAVMLWVRDEAIPRTDLVVTSMLGLGTLIPTLIGYPSMHTIAEPAIAVGAFVYCSSALLLGRAIDWRRAYSLLRRQW